MIIGVKWDGTLELVLNTLNLDNRYAECLDEENVNPEIVAEYWKYIYYGGVFYPVENVTNAVTRPQEIKNKYVKLQKNEAGDWEYTFFDKPLSEIELLKQQVEEQKELIEEQKALMNALLGVVE